MCSPKKEKANPLAAVATDAPIVAAEAPVLAPVETVAVEEAKAGLVRYFVPTKLSR